MFQPVIDFDDACLLEEILRDDTCARISSDEDDLWLAQNEFPSSRLSTNEGSPVSAGIDLKPEHSLEQKILSRNLLQQRRIDEYNTSLLLLNTEENDDGNEKDDFDLDMKFEGEADPCNRKMWLQERSVDDAEIISRAIVETLSRLNVDPTSREGKSLKRRVRNRMSAQLHRERKKAYIQYLENLIREQQKKLDQLIEENSLLKANGVPIPRLPLTIASATAEHLSDGTTSASSGSSPRYCSDSDAWTAASLSDESEGESRAPQRKRMRSTMSLFSALFLFGFTLFGNTPASTDLVHKEGEMYVTQPIKLDFVDTMLLHKDADSVPSPLRSEAAESSMVKAFSSTPIQAPPLTPYPLSHISAYHPRVVTPAIGETVMWKYRDRYMQLYPALQSPAMSPLSMTTTDGQMNGGLNTNVTTFPSMDTSNKRKHSGYLRSRRADDGLRSNTTSQSLPTNPAQYQVGFPIQYNGLEKSVPVATIHESALISSNFFGHYQPPPLDSSGAGGGGPSTGPSGPSTVASLSQVLMTQGRALLDPNLVLALPLSSNAATASATNTPAAATDSVSTLSGGVIRAVSTATAATHSGPAATTTSPRIIGGAGVVAPVPETPHMLTMLLPASAVRWGNDWKDGESWLQRFNATTSDGGKSAGELSNAWIEIGCTVFHAHIVQNVTLF